MKNTSENRTIAPSRFALDGARSRNPQVQKQFDRLAQLALSPRQRSEVLGLERITALLARLGNPQNALAPVIHIAGTNGKGSTCAFLRAMLEASGYRVHVYTSPHLVRFNERIRLAGRLIDDALLAAVLEEVLDHSADIEPSFFEATTAAAMVAFARVPADVVILEVGLGGRLDATNVVAQPLATAIASLGLDHQAFLLADDPTIADLPREPIARIAYEKASIAKRDVPLVTMRYAAAAQAQIAKIATQTGAVLIEQGDAWEINTPSASSPACGAAQAADAAWFYRDRQGEIALPLPQLAGAHQLENAALAVAILRHQSVLAVSKVALAEGIQRAQWPARLQCLPRGALSNCVGETAAVWLDGGHNPDSALRLAEFFVHRQAAYQAHGRAQKPRTRSLVIILGMVANKDAAAFIEALAPPACGLVAVPIAGHVHHAPAVLADLAKAAGIAKTAEATSLAEAMHHAVAIAASQSRLEADSEAKESRPCDIAILGSLYLAGEALSANNTIPD